MAMNFLHFAKVVRSNLAAFIIVLGCSGFGIALAILNEKIVT